MRFYIFFLKYCFVFFIKLYMFTITTNDTKLISCNTCINTICGDCISKIDYELDIDETDETINLTFKCPCCNSVNILDETHKDYSKIYKDKTTEMIMDMLEMKRSFIYVKSQLK